MFLACYLSKQKKSKKKINEYILPFQDKFIFYTTVKPRPEAHMDMIFFEVFLKSIDLIPQPQI